MSISIVDYITYAYQSSWHSVRICITDKYNLHFWFYPLHIENDFAIRECDDPVGQCQSGCDITPFREVILNTYSA